jgi:DNA (cytosine-5)-methyltransferase 1
LFPKKSKRKPKFQFIDLFAGIGGIRRAFESIDGECVFTSEWNKYSVRTYKANHYCDHPINGDIREITEGAPEDKLMDFIDRKIPDHHVLLAGFPCQPFSLAGVSKKNSMGMSHGFDCKIQGTLFFDICKIIKAKRPACFLLENVKNLKSHNKGDTYRTILAALDDLGYDVPNPRVIDASAYVPQHRERIVIVGFRKDLAITDRFDFSKVSPAKNFTPVSLREILDSDNEVDDKYTLTEGLWKYLQGYKEKHRAKGNGFGYDLFTPESTSTRTLSARYYKDGSEILLAKSSEHAASCELGEERPRRLTPRECGRLMGFEKSLEARFKIPVSDTQAYKQFGNSVVVPVFEAAAKQMKNAVYAAVELELNRFLIQKELALKEKAAKYSVG